MFTYKRVSIDICDTGRFTATIAEVELSADTLAGLRLQIDKELSNTKKMVLALPVIGVVTRLVRHGDDIQSIGRATLTGVNRTSRELQFDGVPKGCEMSHALPDTPENAAIVARWLEVSKEHTGLYNILQIHRLKPSGYGRIEMEDYNAVLDEVTASYEKAKAIKK